MAINSIQTTVYSSTTTDYSEYEAELIQIAELSATSKKNHFFTVELDDKDEATTFMHAAKTYAADKGLVYTQKRGAAANVKIMRFNTPKVDETDVDETDAE